MSNDVIRTLKANLDGDPVAIMSKARVLETITLIERLRAELSAERERNAKLSEDNIRRSNGIVQVEAERDALRELLLQAREFVADVPTAYQLLDDIDALLNKGDGDE